MKTPKPTRVPLGNFKDWKGNPRSITEDEMKALQASLRKNGMVTTVVARTGTFELIGGHQRIDALHQMKAAGEKVPSYVWAILLDLSDDESHQLNVSLNRTGGDFDDGLLGDLFAGLEDISIDDALAMGFELNDVNALIAVTHLDLEAEAAVLEKEASDLKSFSRSVTLTMEFETVAERDSVKEWLRQAATASGIKAGTVIAQLVTAKEAKMAKQAPKVKRRRRRAQPAA